jgi:hypothetical protein
MSDVRDTDSFLPHFQMSIGGREIGFLPRTQLFGARRLDGPPFVQTFSVKRRVRNFAASEWTATVFDSGGDLLEELVISLHLQNTEAHGRTSYTMGFTTSSGVGVFYPKVYGIVKRLHPFYMREGVRVTIEGVDLGIEDMRMALPVDIVLAVAPEMPVTEWIASAFATAGVSVEVTSEPAEEFEAITMSKYEEFIGDSETNNAASVMWRVYSRGSSGTADSVTVSDFMSIVKDYITFASDKDAYIRFDGMEENGVLKVKIVNGTSLSVKPPVFISNSQKKNRETDNIFVENFAPSLDPLPSALFAPVRETIPTVDRLTRKVTNVTVGPEDETGVAVGSGVLVAREKDGLLRTGTAKGPRLGFDREREADVVANSMKTDAQLVIAARNNIHRRFSRLPFRASMKLHFPHPSVQPYTHVQMRVLTNKGQDPVTSGRYRIEDMTYTMDLGNFYAVVTAVKSGGRSLPGTPEETNPGSVGTTPEDDE